MALVSQFAPPAFLPDFEAIPGQAEAWHQAMMTWFDLAIKSELLKVKNQKGKAGQVQFYNPARLDPGGSAVEQAIVWNAFPKELLRMYGRIDALGRADQLQPISRYSTGSDFQGPVLDRTLYRPLTEYCEWHVLRDSYTNKILSVTFSSEPPEFWQSLFGDLIQIDAKNSIKFPGNRQRVLTLYRELVSPEVQIEDLICHETIQSADGKNVLAVQGQYNPWNKWNTTHGIMHLNAPPNSLFAEIQLGADATVLYVNSRGSVVSDPSALICCAAYGGPDRNSDPTIGASVNALARLGAMITLPNPVGLYMDHIDLSGWAAPDNGPVMECVQVVRGLPGMIERLKIEVPKDRGFTVSDLTIGGEPVEYGGQIAECITVKLVGSASQLGTVQNQPIPCVSRCCLDPSYPRILDRAVPLKSPCRPGTVPAFRGEGSVAPEGQAHLEPEVSMHLRSGLRFRSVPFS